ncbi:MAG: hypothetical protein NTW87_21275, partial [Planctomycetota bacterium]|nr:hypothetical protein [Planctomycetota bacterium]
MSVSSHDSSAIPSAALGSRAQPETADADIASLPLRTRIALLVLLGLALSLLLWLWHWHEVERAALGAARAQPPAAKALAHPIEATPVAAVPQTPPQSP